MVHQISDTTVNSLVCISGGHFIVEK